MIYKTKSNIRRSECTAFRWISTHRRPNDVARTAQARIVFVLRSAATIVIVIVVIGTVHPRVVAIDHKAQQSPGLLILVVVRNTLDEGLYTVLRIVFSVLVRFVIVIVGRGVVSRVVVLLV